MKKYTGAVALAVALVVSTIIFTVYRISTEQTKRETGRILKRIDD
jgi:hypothetical protein